jgi:hypothetical protein
MSQPGEKGHTLKSITEDQFVPPLQKRILLCLAANSPLNKNETARGIKGYYKSTWTALDSLERKGIITKVKTEKYRGREYSRFWLTTAGVFIALVEGCNPKKLLTRTIEMYPENKTLQCVVEVATILGTDMYKIGYSAILRKRKLEKSDVSLMLGTQLMKDLSLEQIENLIKIVKKYPEQFGNFKEQTDQIQENLKRVERFIQES